MTSSFDCGHQMGSSVIFQPCDSPDFVPLDVEGTKVPFSSESLHTDRPSAAVSSVFSTLLSLSHSPFTSSPPLKAKCLSHNRLLYCFFTPCLTFFNVICRRTKVSRCYTGMGSCFHDQTSEHLQIKPTEEKNPLVSCTQL